MEELVFQKNKRYLIKFSRIIFFNTVLIKVGSLLWIIYLDSTDLQRPVTTARKEYKIVLEEVQAVIKQFSTNKAHLSQHQGVTFSRSQADFLLQMNKLNISSGWLPRLLYQANIELVLNKGWDHLDSSDCITTVIAPSRANQTETLRDCSHASCSVRLYAGF